MLICPVCGQPLQREDKSYRCAARHCFDVSKYGYVNLLLSRGSSAARHGDDMAMLTARRDFLDAGFYAPLRDAVCRLADECVAEPSATLADIGCGEGYYTAAVRALPRIGEAVGVDISTAALKMAHRRLPDITLAAASAFHLPLAGGRFGCILNLFAPHSADELHRVCAPNGVVIRAFPLARHLWQLKQTLYDEVYENKADSMELVGFEQCGRQDLRYEITLGGQSEIQSLFQMTPYFYKSSREAAARLAALKTLSTQVEFCVIAYRKLP